MRERLLSLTLAELAGWHPAITDFLVSADGDGAKPSRTLRRWLDDLPDDRLTHIGMDREQVLGHVEALARQVEALRASAGRRLQSLTILGGRDKNGGAEDFTLTLVPGDVLCIVGPTGSGKSRLLADIECLAGGDTPSGRRILIDGAAPARGQGFGAGRTLVAQLSQTMNFVVDLTVAEFVAMHANCRMVENPEAVAARVIACANDLAGEKFAPTVAVTQLSGGQARALMIADAALLSASPVVLIDEIENAGVDRRRALELLVSGEKIVLISTHDPLLALYGGQRLVIRNGGVAALIETSEAEKRTLARLERVDAGLMDLRERLRAGERIESAPGEWS